jgi:hypothetical protein
MIRLVERRTGAGMTGPSTWPARVAWSGCFGRAAAVVCAAAAVVSVTGAGWGYTPDSPEVRRIVDKALDFLAASDEEKRLGGKCLVGLAFLKVGDAQHPKVKEAVEACQEFTSHSVEEMAEHPEVYSLGLSIIFLCELDPVEYRSQIDKLLAALEQRQQEGGGWGYISSPYSMTGDTSMTQYAVLALWTAYQAGIVVPQETVLKVCQWLLRTQDPSGAWGYQGKDPKSFKREAQSEIRPSTSAAGLGSVYVCANLLGLDATVREVHSDVPDLPDVLIPVQTGLRSMDIPQSGALASYIKRAEQDGSRWMQENFTVNPRQWKLYYFYALERYYSFREVAEGRSEREPKWYDDVVNEIRSVQSADGGFEQELGRVPATAFAVLFLLRSTKTSLMSAQLGEGLLVGGRGLPRELRGIRIRDGQIVSTTQVESMAQFLAILEDPNHPDLESLATDPSITRASVTGELDAGDIDRLRRLARSGTPTARRLAVRTLASRRDLDNVATFIYALTDPDGRVVREARDALRFVSRKFDGLGLPERATPEQRTAEIRAWRNWYREIDPQAELPDTP